MTLQVDDKLLTPQLLIRCLAVKAHRGTAELGVFLRQSQDQQIGNMRINLDSTIVDLAIKPSFQKTGYAIESLAAAAATASLPVLHIHTPVPPSDRALESLAALWLEPHIILNTRRCQGQWRESWRQQYQQLVENSHKKLSIPDSYSKNFKLDMIPDAFWLRQIGQDVFEREQYLTPAAAAAWSEMRTAAENDGIELAVVSAFRDCNYQCGIIQRKLDQGMVMPDILKVSAAPGYSEHHSGCALDLTCPEGPHLETCFEKTSQFKWLCSNAARFGFHLSYPRDNKHGIAYEPWHWAFHQTDSTSDQGPAALS